MVAAGGGTRVDAQRALIESAAARGVEAAWFFQTGTSLPPMGDDEDDETRTTKVTRAR